MEKKNEQTSLADFPESKEILDLINRLADKLEAESRPLSSIVMLIDEAEDNALLNIIGEPRMLCKAILNAMIENKNLMQIILIAVGQWSIATNTDLAKIFSYIPRKKGGGNTVVS